MANLFRPLSAEYQEDPYRVFQHLRDNEPCFWSDEAQSWVVTRYDDCKYVLRENEVFARDRSRAGLTKQPRSESIQSEDPPAQLVLRRRILAALHSQDLGKIASNAFAHFSDRLDSAPKGQNFDIMADAVAPAAMKLITSAVGVVGFDPTHYLNISFAFSRAMDSGLDPQRLADGQAAGTELRTRVHEWFAAEATSGMMQALVSDEVIQSELISKGDNYLHNTVGGVFNAGFGTAYAITGALLELYSEMPEIFHEARSAPDISVAVAEIIRYLSPAQGTSRFATQDCEIQGKLIQRGDVVIVLMASANRDERFFTAPDSLDFTRQPNQHLAFAWGPHVCLGAQLAEAWVRELIVNYEHWAALLTVEKITYLDTATLRSVRNIIVRKS